jgi:hypothetical protein
MPIDLEYFINRPVTDISIIDARHMYPGESLTIIKLSIRWIIPMTVAINNNMQ